MISVEDMPALNAGLNGLSVLFLTAGYAAIKSGRPVVHGWCMGSALVVSAVFLFFYVLHKILVGGVHTVFGGEGWIRAVYYGMLISHILLAMVILPLILLTVRQAWRRNWTGHRQWARWTFPAWYYVSVTGVLVYFFLYEWFPAGS